MNTDQILASGRRVVRPRCGALRRVESALPLALLAALLLSAPVRAGSAKLLWQIGRRDNSAAEFALGPGGYAGYARDGLFVVGRSDPKRDWPYCHPGPADAWAGGRPHAFTIYFGLAERPSGACRLIVDLANTHPERPPQLAIDVNGRRFERACPPGGPDASIQGDAKAFREHVFTVEIPPDLLRPGLNRIRIVNAGPSWMLYDWAGLEAPASTRLAPANGAILDEAKLSPWLSRRRGRLVQELVARLSVVGDPGEVTLEADGLPLRRFRPDPGENTAVFFLPPVKKARTVRVALRAGGRLAAERTIEQKPARERTPADYVDCLLGTGSSRWMLFPGAAMPFGMVKLSPDNQRQSWKAGYEYTIHNIAGFSHIHSWTMGGLLTMPATGPLKIAPGPERDPDAGYRSRFRHETEIAKPGYYAVTLDDYGIRAELTASTRAGFQRYTFPKSDSARVLFDLKIETEYGYELLDAEIRRVSDTEIEGYAKQRGGRGAGWNEYTVHFVARLNKPFRSMGGWVNGRVLRDVRRIHGKGDVGCFLSFSTREGEKILLKTGISLVSVDQARLNLDTELSRFGWGFDAARAAARDVWNRLLGAIEVEGGSETDKVKFYSNMYRAYCARTIWSDVNGKYVDMCERVRQLPDPDSPVYGCDAFWNTFWNLNQLWILVHPRTAEKWVRSLLEIYDKGGWLPKGPTGIEYSSIMVASHEIALIVAAYQAGIRGFDAAKAYEAIRKIQTTPGRPHPGGGYVGNRQLASYMKLGYVPDEKGPVSNTLEYAYDDWCAAQLAKALGKEDDCRYFLKRSLNYRNVFDPLVGFVRRRRADGRWVRGFSPFDGRGFVEGNSWQYTWFVPHDVGGLIRLLGPTMFNDRLNAGLERSRGNRFNAAGDRMADYPINHGNQPNMQAAWLFNYSGKPWLTQKWVREILDVYYGSGPIDGYPGDEDQGQMGAWFVMSAMGLFQMDGGCAVHPVYEISSPLFERVTIRLDRRYYPGKRLVIEAPGVSRENRYIQRASWNGKPLDRPWIPQAELVKGGRLLLEVGSRPNPAWGGSLDAAPPSVPRD